MVGNFFRAYDDEPRCDEHRMSRAGNCSRGTNGSINVSMMAARPAANLMGKWLCWNRGSVGNVLAELSSVEWS
jgi:hypothetical protein